MKKSKQVKYRYSGNKSKNFWNIINTLNNQDRQEMYSLGVALQNLEDQVLRQLKNINISSVKQKR